MLENGGRHYRNYSGCGNTLNGNHPIVREMIFHCLRHWVHNYHVDGFRFDLASILSRDRDGEPGAQSAGGRVDRRRPAAGRHQDHRRGVGRRRGLPGGHVRQPPLGRMERPLPRRRAPLLARRPAHARARWPRGWPAPATSTRPSGRRPVPQHQLHHLARRLHAERPGRATTTSTTRPTARATATATTTTTATTTASKGRRRPRDVERRPAAADQEHAGHAAA